jgi:hypothetical protein
VRNFHSTQEESGYRMRPALLSRSSRVGERASSTVSAAVLASGSNGSRADVWSGSTGGFDKGSTGEFDAEFDTCDDWGPAEGTAEGSEWSRRDLERLEEDRERKTYKIPLTNSSNISNQRSHHFWPKMSQTRYPKCLY